MAIGYGLHAPVGKSMDLRRIRYFLAVARCASLETAARGIGKSGKTIAGQLTRLEEELESRLFVDLAGGDLRLTPAGQGYRDDCERILAELDSAQAIACHLAEGHGGVLRLGICEDAATLWLTTGLRRFKTLYPALDLDLREMPSVDLATALRRHEIDLALMLPGVDRSELEIVPLWSDGWQVIVPKRWRPLPEGRPICCEDIAEDLLVLAHPMMGAAGHDCIRKAFADAGIAPRIAALCLGRSTMLALGLIDAGLTFVPQSLSWARGGSSRSLPFVAPDLDIVAAYRAANPPGIAMRFLRTLQDAVAALRLSPG